MNEPQREDAADREAAAVAARYARRDVGDRYSPSRPEVRLMLQERRRAMLRRFAHQGLVDLARLRLLEVGCGTGGNLLELMQLGFLPQHLAGIELLPERCAAARSVLPAAVDLREGDALRAELPPASFDIVFVSTVFSSLLDDEVQQRLADAIWRWLRPGGGVLWYDFVVDNPRNADVRGVSVARVRNLFAQAASVHAERVTLAPPLARVLVRVHPALYTVFNAVPWLRTHALAWVAKPAA